MRVVPLALFPVGAVREALTRRGIEGGRADGLARGLTPSGVIIDGIDHSLRDALNRAAARQRVAVVSGEGWVLLASGAAELAGLARAAAGDLPVAVTEGLSAAVRGRITPPVAWEMGRGSVSLERPVVVGIVNVTPDSFSDGGKYLDADAAIAHADALIAAGADALDLGAESTRPGRPAPVSPAEEWRRLEPVLRELVRQHPRLPITVDTVKAETARRALAEGAWAINDVSGLRLDPEIADACAAADAGLVLMHSRGGFEAMASYDAATYEDVGAEVIEELTSAAHLATGRGIDAARLVLDPGLGFAKRPEHNLAVLAGLGAIVALGWPVMVGPSRKRFLGVVTGKGVEARDGATAAACVAAYDAGARLFRVHNVAMVRDALDVAHAIGCTA